MAQKSLLVNLDAMISRDDFASTSASHNQYENISTISIRDFTPEGLVGRNLRKPDFQRETNHWTPEQVVSLLECFIHGDLIPSVILWQSDSFLFVIDGGHRLSVLRAWVEDDYGDGPISSKFFGDAVSQNQKKAADKTRNLIAEKIGSYQHFKTKIDKSEIDSRVSSVISRALPIQWVKGTPDKAESSFFKINTQGTPLDNIEESLLKYRKRPIAIAARAVIRAGKGHKYWSNFEGNKAGKIEKLAKDLHKTLFDPEISSPIKTLDLPLGGSKGIRSALQILIEYFVIACFTQGQKSITIEYGEDDESGDSTLSVLEKAFKLAQRITGNDKGSLGLHPAVYFYGPSGVHSSPMFLGTAKLISEKISNNDQSFFSSFSSKREQIENVLIENKDLIATIIQKLGSKKRVNAYCGLLNEIFNWAKNGKSIAPENLVAWAGLSGKIIVGQSNAKASGFSDRSKSKIFIHSTLNSAPKCKICKGFIDVPKSVSYDHIQRKRDGGTGEASNGQLTHPYCNQAVKN